MKDESLPRPRLSVRSEEQSAHAADALQAETPTTLSFETPEELVRHDRAQTVVPDTLAQRVEDSVAQLPSPAKPWWRRWF